eukprot:Platyproteum_vivax@DN16039_c0_g1_i1.p1
MVIWASKGACQINLAYDQPASKAATPRKDAKQYIKTFASSSLGSTCSRTIFIPITSWIKQRKKIKKGWLGINNLGNPSPLNQYEMGIEYSRMNGNPNLHHRQCSKDTQILLMHTIHMECHTFHSIL